MCFDEIPFACQCEKEDKKGYGFQISHFCAWFSNEIMTVKGVHLTIAHAVAEGSSKPVWPSGKALGW